MFFEKLIKVTEKANIVVGILGIVLSGVVAAATRIQELKEN